MDEKEGRKALRAATARTVRLYENPKAGYATLGPVARSIIEPLMKPVTLPRPAR